MIINRFTHYAEVQDTPVRCGQVAVSLGRVDETDEELIYLSTSTPEDGRGCHVLLSPDQAAELISANACRICCFGVHRIITVSLYTHSSHTRQLCPPRPLGVSSHARRPDTHHPSGQVGSTYADGAGYSAFGQPKFSGAPQCIWEPPRAKKENEEKLRSATTVAVD